MDAGIEEARSAHADLFQMGVMLFWAEGARNRNAVRFSNSDPAMIRLFMRFLTDACGVDRSRVTLVVQCYTDNGLTAEEVENFWLRTCALPRENLRKTEVDKISKASKRKVRRLLHGVAHLRVGDTALSMRLHGAIQGFSGCERPDWVDLGPLRSQPADA